MNVEASREKITRDFLARMVRLGMHLPTCHRASVYTLKHGEVAVCTCRLDYLAALYGIEVTEEGDQ